MCPHDTLLAAFSAAALLAAHVDPARAAPPGDVDTTDDACFSGFEASFGDTASIPGGRAPALIALFLDGRPCIEILPEDRACSMRSPPEAVCRAIAPLSIAEGWCSMERDGSWSAKFQVQSSRLLADDVPHTLTAYVVTPKGVSVREADVVVTTYRPWSPSGDGIVCFEGGAEF